MGVEIERKFLVRDDGWRSGVTEHRMVRQGYLATDDTTTVRVRIAGDEAWITIKGKAEGLRRAEFEYAIPVSEADELMELCRGRVVEKVRHIVPQTPHVWEIDVFGGSNAGLVVAEIELDSEDEAVELPAWIGKEVSDDSRYLNARLAVHPCSRW
ncbi:MAG: CYTH domain-containing protein [Chthoniobacterales bacterium]|nr:CYTH domain-containing protein [Chthoniobacterales bacterium]